MSRRNVLLLFDVDGTLTEMRKTSTKDIYELLKRLKEKVYIGTVSGGEINKLREQLGDDAHLFFDYCFTENGLVAYKNGQRLTDQFSNEYLNEIINWCLNYIANLDIPVKRGTFVEFRTGLINISPIGRNCTQAERDAFSEYNIQHNIVPTMIKLFQEKFGKDVWQCSIGGQISFDLFPKGWTKEYCTRHLKEEGFEEIHFFGDRTFPGGNDYELFQSPGIIGHTVKNYKDTIDQCEKYLDSI